ncbi:MAG: hypothetical protein ABI456_09660 [Ktedonobacteraceae bacterium]|nr:hypothetical protein [Chloroflexota bacterium]
MNYRKQLLLAVEAFLEGTPSSHLRAQRILQRCEQALWSEAREATFDRMIWGFYAQALTDSVFYESESYLQETRATLLGEATQPIARTVTSDDFRPYFTADEAEWYAHLLSMVEFLTAVPFTTIHEATFPAWQQKDAWATLRKSIPEAMQAEELDAAYERRQVAIEALVTRTPFPKNLGDVKIYQLVLREVTSVITGLHVGRSAVVYGYPSPRPPYNGVSFTGAPIDMSASIAWAMRALKAIAGMDAIFITWRLGKAASFGADMLLVSLQ